MTLKYVPISELQSGTRILAVYLLQNPQVRNKKDGGSFASMILRDATGRIPCVMWDGFDGLSTGQIKENDFVEISGEVVTYNGQMQIKAGRIRKVRDEDVDETRFLPVSPVPVADMERDLAALIAQITDPDLSRLVKAIFSNEELMSRFRRAPSAVSMHQAYLGGLLEHTLCVVKNALKIADNYPQANRSLLIAAGLLHDLGKTMEFVYDKKIAYSDVGRLLGHISMGNALVEVQCSKMPGFPPAKKVLVQHIILSHHGMLEFGSPKRPKTLEAIILHHADLIDAQISNYQEAVANAARTGNRWEYSAMFERYLMLAEGDDVEGSDLMRQLVYANEPAAAILPGSEKARRATIAHHDPPTPDDYAQATPAADLLAMFDSAQDRP
ncbi:MAG: HD domain-containing protein [Candidatus Sumerlaeaceae bacterium]|nr:HD domain-containing protein [Candidatus Sumerlaeaceae bacterium]